MPKSRSTDAGSVGNRPSSAIRTNCCDAWFTGLNSAHCSNCHQTFTAAGGFDLHRHYGKCRNPATARSNKTSERLFVVADKPWPGWSRPGSWKGPDE